MMSEYSYPLNKEAKVQYYWRCKTRFCSATLITTRNISTGGHSISTEGEIHHLHGPSIAKQEIRVFRTQVKRRVREELTPVALLIEQEMRKINLSSEAQQLSTHPQHMKAAFSRERHKCIPNIPRSLDFIIPHMYTLTRGFERFLLNDETQGESAGSKHQILLQRIEGAEQVLEILKHAKHASSCEKGTSLHRRLVSEGLAIAYRDEEKVQGLANICALSSQYRGMEYPCANIDMQDRLISLVNAGIPDGKSELELKNNGFKSGRAYKLIQKEQQQLLNVVENSEFFQQKKEIDHILYKALQPLKVRCNSVINLANKHMTWNPRKTDNDDVRLSDSANEEVKNPGEEDQETREQLYQDLDAEIILQNRQRSSSTKNVIGVSSEPYLDLIFNPFNKRQWNYLSLDHLLDYLIIRVTDKGNNFYIDSVGEFEQKAGKFFSDTNAFIELSYNPFNEILNKVIQLLNTLRGKDLIRKWQYEQMMPDRTKCELAHLYFNPKTHKDGIPVRPIESTIHAANTKISKFFDKILRPIFDYKCKDTTIIDVLL
ncbi:unnamed protein product [Rotaria socialis]|uniref:FLYWCH-type domain-containing protein n=1 Tax=Rotaria socialis TaxID=392032 RepID=A0A820ZZ74_9BILA|nr:unnamed protein product [Rotaria socialis]